MRRTISCLRQDDILACGSDLDRLTLLIIKTTQHDADDINNLPDKETTTCHELQDAGNDLAGVDAMHTANAAAYQQAEQEAGETGTGGLAIAVVTAAHSGMCVLGVIKVRGRGC